MRAALAALVALVALAGLALPSAASARTPSPGRARLQGQFLMAGRVTVAQNVRGEHVGEHVRRTWTFTPACPVGACGTVILVRTRPHATDRAVLHRRAPGYYTGHGSFYAPLRCGGRTYHRGETVPFRITVRITEATLSNGTVLATRLKATYRNRSRTNRTPCVVLPGHDAASYHGHLA